MGSLTSTTIVVVGEGAPETIGALHRFANVSATVFTTDSDDEVRRWEAGVHSPYLAHNRDPLAHVAAAWVEFYDDQTTLGTLDLEVDRTLAAFERHDLAMPDYYVVTDPERLSPTWQHWWLGVLPQAAPTRVIPWGAAVTTSLGGALRSLPASRPWPEPEPWLHTVARTIPARLGSPSDGAAFTGNTDGDSDS